MFTQRLVITLLCIVCGCNLFAEEFYKLPHNPTLTKAETYILLNQPDSAQLALNTINDSVYTDYIRFLNEHIIQPDISHHNLSEFIVVLNNKSEIQPILCHRFLKKLNIQTPDPSKGIDKDYVVLISNHLTLLADRGLMNEASEVFEQFDQYLKHFSKETRTEKIAHFARNVYPIMLSMASRNPEEGLKFCEENLDIAKDLNENKYLIKAHALSLPFIMMQGDLNQYINTCQQLIDLEEKQPVKTSQYGITIFNLLDALIYKAYSSKDVSQIGYIKGLLDKVYQSPSLITHVNSYNYYVQFLKLVDEDSKIAQDIFQQFKVKNLPELCDLTIAKSKDQFAKVELISIYSVIKKTLKAKGYYKEALKVAEESNTLIRENYSEDLSNQLASHKVSIAENEKEHAVQLLETRSQLYTYIFIFLFIIIAIIVWTIRFQIRKNKALDKSNQEKLLLLKEIHHRVKNNFQIASGLLELQFKDVQDAEIQTLVHQWQTRIKSMTSIHQKLYQNDLLLIDLRDYISSIANDLNRIYGDPKTNIHIDIKETYHVDIDTAVNLGLILTELITNAFKYGKKNDQLSLSISCEKHKDEYKLHVSDKGNGIDSTVDLMQSNTLGIKLIKQLLKQLQGHLSYQNNNGACFALNFKDSNQRILVD